jgi:hypothetical protein
MTEISNVNNKYILSQETSYGTPADNPVQLDFGLVQSISLTEDEGLREVGAINTGHTLASVEDGLYSGSISLTTYPTKNSLPNLLKALFGKVDLDEPTSGKYTAITLPIHSDNLSYYMEANDDNTNLWEIYGIGFSEGTLNIANGSIVSIDLSGSFKVALKQTGTITPSTNINEVYHELDCYVSIDNFVGVLDAFSVTLNWNVNNEEGRGIEQVTEGERRLIQRIIRHNLTVSGNFTSTLNQEINTGYIDDRTPIIITANLNRGTDNLHSFTIIGAKTTNRSNEMSGESAKKVFSADFTGTDITVVGDLFEGS